MISLNDPGIVRALRDFGLLKYIRLSRMRQQIELLEFLVQAWDPAIEAFHIKNQVVPITVKDVYFLTGLSRRGLPISLSGSVSWRRDSERLCFATLLSRVRAKQRWKDKHPGC